MKKSVFVYLFLLLASSANVSAQTSLSTTLTRQQLRDSLAVASEQLSFHPDSLDLRLRKAGWNLQLEQWQYARDEYDYVLKREPYNIAALFYRAFVNEKQQRYKFAKLDYENLLSVVSDHFEGRLGLALLNDKDNRYTEAMNQINLLIMQHPDSAVAYAARAGMEVERKMYAPAEYDYGKAIELAPGNTDYLLSRANVRILMKRKAEARQDLDRMVGLGVARASLVGWYRKCR